MKRAICIIVLLACITLPFRSNSQIGWDISVGYHNTWDFFYDMDMMPNGQFLAVGHRITGVPAPPQGRDSYWAFIDAMGNIISEHRDTSSVTMDHLYRIIPGTNDAVVLGGTRSYGPPSIWSVMLQSINSSGGINWRKKYSPDTTKDCMARSFLKMGDGGYLIMASVMGQNGYPVRMRTDAAGNLLWLVGDTINNLNFGSYCYGMVRSGNTIYTLMNSTSGNRTIIFERDTSGNILDTVFVSAPGVLPCQPHPGANEENYNKLMLDTDGNPVYISNNPLIMSCTTRVVKVDIASEDTLWTVKIPPSSLSGAITLWYGQELVPAPGGGYMLLMKQDGTNINTDYARLIKIGNNHQIAWTKNFRRQNYTNSQNTSNNQLVSLRPLTGGGYMMAGYYGSSSAIDTLIEPEPNGWLIVTDTAGNTAFNEINGVAYADLNNNCIYDQGDGVFGNLPVTISQNGDIDYTDTNGFYSFPVAGGTFTVSTPGPGPLWQACPPDSATFTLAPNFYNDTTFHFGFQSTANCPYLTVDHSAPFLRRCFNMPYQVTYCNHGTINATNAYLVITVDPAVSFTSSSMPYTLSGNQYTFQLGNLAPFQCGSIQLQAFSDCLAPLGSTACIEAHIFPDSACAAIPGYDHSDIEVDGACQGDTLIRFRLRNIGPGNMVTPRPYFVYEDNVICTTAPFLLPAGDSVIVNVVPVAGHTYTLKAEQHPAYPGTPFSIDFVELCGNAPFSTGYINQFQQADLDDHKEIDCYPILGAFDPNDKEGIPNGFLAQHYISNTNEIEYRIRFQNTGNDTAFTVVIRDTLSPFLDPLTIHPGESSHPYSFSLLNGNEMIFTFNHILLVDSFTNEPASHGFVKYKVRQQPNNPIGTVIYNTAYIYFDFNDPVITPSTFHTIGDPNLYNPSTVSVNAYENQLTLLTYPIPFRDKFRIVVDGKTDPEFDVRITDITGRVIFTGHYTTPVMEVDGSIWNAGIYLIEISSNGQILGKGKIIKQ